MSGTQKKQVFPLVTYKSHPSDYILLVLLIFKVAESLLNPFGDDDEDFEHNWLVDRHMKV